MKIRKVISNFLNRTVQDFFNDKEVRPALCRAIQDCGSSGATSLQEITSGLGNNVTDNALQITGADNIDLSKDGVIVGGSATQSFTAHVSEGQVKSQVTISDEVVTISAGFAYIKVDNQGNIVVNTNNPDSGGIQYNEDYSPSYTSRSLVDKAYVDAAIANALIP